MAATYKLRLKGKNFPDLDTFSKSDPRAWVFRKSASGELVELGQTETIENQASPEWQTTITVAVAEGEEPSSVVLVFEVYDIDEEGKGKEAQDLIGSIELGLEQVLKAPGKQLARPLMMPDKKTGRGVLVVCVE